MIYKHIIDILHYNVKYILYIGNQQLDRSHVTLLTAIAPISQLMLTEWLIYETQLKLLARC